MLAPQYIGKQFHMNRMIMDTIFEVLMATFTLFMGLLFIRHGWLVFIKKRAVLSITDKIIISIAHFFRGKDQALEMEAHKLEINNRERAAFEVLVTSGILVTIALLLYLDAILN